MHEDGSSSFGWLVHDYPPSRATEEFCRSFCGRDCEQVEYFLVEHPRRVFAQNDSSSDRWTFLIDYPKQIFEITRSADLPLTSLLFSLVNAASFWISFCPLTLVLSDAASNLCVNLVAKLVAYFPKRRQRSVNPISSPALNRMRNIMTSTSDLPQASEAKNDCSVQETESFDED